MLGSINIKETLYNTEWHAIKRQRPVISNGNSNLKISTMMCASFGFRILLVFMAVHGAFGEVLNQH